MTQVLRNGNNLKLVRFEIELDEFPQCLKSGIGDDGVLAATEILARELVKKEFNHDMCVKFVNAVWAWGEFPFRSEMVLNNNTIANISVAFQNAYNASIQGDVRESLKAITSIHGLAVSFGSKHLKFLDPDRNVVLDKIISECLGYRRDVEGYLDWLDTCHKFLVLVREAEIPYPGIGQNGWRVADIEMAIFNKIRAA